MKRAVYDKRFKMAAVKHALNMDQSVNDIAKELGISGITLRRWINEYDDSYPGVLLCEIKKSK